MDVTVRRKILLIYIREGDCVLPDVFIRLFVCLPVSSFTQKLPIGPSWKILPELYLWTLNFSKLFASVSGSRNFLKDSLTPQNKAFCHNIAYISGKETDEVVVKISSLDKEVQVKFSKSPGSRFVS